MARKKPPSVDHEVVDVALVKYPDVVKAGVFEKVGEGFWSEVGKVGRYLEGVPIAAEKAALPARAVWNRTHEVAPGTEPSVQSPSIREGIVEMLEDYGRDDQVKCAGIEIGRVDGSGLNR